ETSFTPTCSLERCDLCEHWFDCEVVGCCWYYNPYFIDFNYCATCSPWEECSWEFCGACLNQETCEAAGCVWSIDTCTEPYCNSQGMAKILGVDIAEIGSKMSALSVDLMTLIALVIGVPLAFMIIKRAIGIMPKK
ncbi:unnamed protein product, partial [marine sediment metagenome]